MAEIQAQHACSVVSVSRCFLYALFASIAFMTGTLRCKILKRGFQIVETAEHDHPFVPEHDLLFQ